MCIQNIVLVIGKASRVYIYTVQLLRLKITPSMEQEFIPKCIAQSSPGLERATDDQQEVLAAVSLSIRIADITTLSPWVKSSLDLQYEILNDQCPTQLARVLYMHVCDSIYNLTNS